MLIYLGGTISIKDKSDGGKVMGTCKICGKNYGLMGGGSEPYTGHDLQVCNSCGQKLKEIDKMIHENNQDAKIVIDSLISTVKDDETQNILLEYYNDVIADKIEVQETKNDTEEINEVIPEESNNNGSSYSMVTENTEDKKVLNSRKSKLPDNKKKVVYAVAGVVFLGLLVGNINNANKYSNLQNKYNKLQADYNKLQVKLQKAGNENLELSDKVSALNDENDELKNGAQKQLNDAKNAYESSDWNKVIELANTLHSKYNGSEEDKEAQKLATESQKKIDEANAAKEAEKAKGYETGITYDQLARTPDDYTGKKVKFTGKVVQVIEGDDSINIRLAVNDNYDTILLGEYSKSIVKSRVLEDDHITIYGSSVGTISYESTMGGTITIPGVYIEKIDQ